MAFAIFCMKHAVSTGEPLVTTAKDTDAISVVHCWDWVSGSVTSSELQMVVGPPGYKLKIII